VNHDGTDLQPYTYGNRRRHARVGTPVEAMR